MKANAVLPTAYTRMTESIPDPGFKAFMEERFTPERVSATVALLAHEDFPYSGELFLSGAGRMARLFLGGRTAATSPTIRPPRTSSPTSTRSWSTDEFIVPADRGSEFASYLPRLGFDFGAGTALVAKDD